MEFEYTIVRSNRKSVSIEVSQDCEITVRVPFSLSQRELDKILAEKKSWLERAVSKQLSKPSAKKEFTESEIEELRRRAKAVIPEKVIKYAKIMQVEPTSVKINSAKKRYGSCTSNNSLNFSLYLMAKDDIFVDYVVIHELAHIKHHNHSKAFYDFVGEFMPNYKDVLKNHK